MATVRNPAIDPRDRDLPLDDAAPGRLRRVPTADGPGPRLMSASTLEGNDVMNHQGETLGEIEEIMLDVPRGRIAYAVMSAGGFLGLGERLFAIPWTALTLDTDRKCFVMNARKERFDDAPGFDKDHWPSEPQREWHDEVHRHYGATPYWD